MKKFFKYLFIPLIILICILFSIYYFGFYPKNQLKSLNSNVEFNQEVFLKKFIPKDLDLSLNKLSFSSTATITENELTDLIIMELQKNPKINEYITGLNMSVLDNSLILDMNLNYKNIPLKSKFIFTTKVENNNIILHYEKGSIGFISVPSNKIFKYLTENEFLKLDSDNQNILIDVSSFKYITINNLTLKDNAINLSFETTFKFFQWLQK